MVVTTGVGIHGEDAFTEEGIVLVLEGDLGELTGEVRFKTLLVGSSVMGAVYLVTIEFVKGNVVAGEKLVTLMYFLVHTRGDRVEKICLR